METIELQPSWLLHYRNYRDTSLILELFTLEHGRMALMARSARAARPAIRALYQPFRPLLLSWTGGSSLKTLIGIEESGQPAALENRALACAYYLNELLIRLLGSAQPQPALFGLYGLALSELAEGRDVEIVLRTFELHLLDALGVLPDFEHATADGQPIDIARRYRYHPASARAVPIADPVDGVAMLKPDRVSDGDPRWHADGITEDPGISLSGATLQALANLDLDDVHVRDEARPLMKRLLHLQLGDRPLKSRELFQALSSSDTGSDTGFDPGSDRGPEPGNEREPCK